MPLLAGLLPALAVVLPAPAVLAVAVLRLLFCLHTQPHFSVHWNPAWLQQHNLMHMDAAEQEQYLLFVQVILLQPQAWLQ